MKIKLLFLLLMVSWVLAACQSDRMTTTEEPSIPQQSEAEGEMVFGIFPYLSPTRLEDLWVPIIVEFNNSSAIKLQFRTTNSFDEFNERLNSTGYDIALIQPFDYIQIKPNTYEPLVKFEEPLSGIFVVRTDSDIQALSDLAGKKVSTPPESAAVTILAHITLNRLGVENVIYSHQPSHDECLHTLLIGEADACLTNIVPLRTFEETLNQKFTILDNTLEIPHVPIVANTRIPQEQKERITNFFLGLNSYEAGQQLLSGAGITGFVEAVDGDYDMVRSYWADFQP